VLGGERRRDVAGSDDALEARWLPVAELAAMEDQFHDNCFHILDALL
jgi:bifunctional NMN adenylyltransferase/nudix hydrolase